MTRCEVARQWEDAVPVGNRVAGDIRGHRTTSPRSRSRLERLGVDQHDGCNLRHAHYRHRRVKFFLVVPKAGMRRSQNRVVEKMPNV